MGQNWKLFRRIFSTLFFLLLTISLVTTVSLFIFDSIITSQFGPVILKFAAGTLKFTYIGILLQMILIVSLSRSYCSLLCPVGYLQDITIWIGNRAGVKPDWKISGTTSKIVRITIITLIFISFIAGNALLAGLLEPFSVYSRFLFLIFSFPVYYSVFNAGLVTSIICLISLLLLLLISVKKGRFFCSWICPCGTILWGLSFLSIFRLKISKPGCGGCKKCVENCKSGAIDDNLRIIDKSLCVGCFNCLSVCETGAIELKINLFKIKTDKDLVPDSFEGDNRRKFIKQITSGMMILFLPGRIFTSGSEIIQSEYSKDHFVFPPGGEDHERFLGLCTGCMVCAVKCPAKIILPSAGNLKSSLVLPVLNFKNGYCTEDCIECSQVCPTGALRKLTKVEKMKAKIADLQLNLNKCIINTYSLECNVCAEICPVDALKMLPQQNNIFPVPVVKQNLCIGCGKCLFRCPAKEKETIFIFN